jgi:hypothetical protein
MRLENGKKCPVKQHAPKKFPKGVSSCLKKLQAVNGCPEVYSKGSFLAYFFKLTQRGHKNLINALSTFWEGSRCVDYGRKCRDSKVEC